MHYRRAKTVGATYFFTVVTFNRQHLFKTEATIQLLRQAFYTVKQRHPYVEQGIYPKDWGADREISFQGTVGWE